MKRFIYPLVIILILVAAAAVLIRPAIVRIAQNQLRQVFVDGDVFIGGSQFSPLRRISLLNVGIKRAGIYDFKIAEINVEYSLASLLRKKILRITLKKAKIKVSLPRKSILYLSQYVNLGSQGPLMVEDLALLDLDLNARSKDVNIDARMSVELTLEDLSIRSLDLSVASLRSRQFLLQDGVLRVNQRPKANEFHIRNIQYDKVKAGNFNGIVRLENGIFFLDAFSTEIFNGLVEGHATLKAGFTPEYLANLNFADLNLERLVNDLDIADKFQMSGLISGWLIINGKGADIEALDGDFSMEKAGGTLVITDPRVLENIAGRSSQSLDILMENFKNYRYNNGTVTLSLEKDNLLVDMALEGETGKRNLNVVVHDFKLTKDGS